MSCEEEGDSRGMRKRETRKRVTDSDRVQKRVVSGPRTRRADDHVGSGEVIKYGATTSQTFVAWKSAWMKKRVATKGKTYLHQTENGDEDEALLAWCEPCRGDDRRRRRSGLPCWRGVGGAHGEIFAGMEGLSRLRHRG